MGKSTISMVIFNSYVSLPEGINPPCVQPAPRVHNRPKSTAWSRAAAAAGTAESRQAPARDHPLPVDPKEMGIDQAKCIEHTLW
jgi:hypothetical protein